jgi:hypothetical protein
MSHMTGCVVCKAIMSSCTSSTPVRSSAPAASRCGNASVQRDISNSLPTVLDTLTVRSQRVNDSVNDSPACASQSRW